MNIKELLTQLDYLYETNPSQVERFLLMNIHQTDSKEIKLSLKNELMGYYRSQSRHSLAMEEAMQCIILLNEIGIRDHLLGATTLLNCATTFKAAGNIEEARLLYERCLLIYRSSLDEKDIRFCSLYNNMSDVYIQLNQEEKAICLLKKVVVLLGEDQVIEKAITWSNLGGIYFNKDKVKAKGYLQRAYDVFSKIEDAHQGMCFVLLGILNKDEVLIEKGLATIKYYFKENEDYYTALNYYRDYLLEMRAINKIKFIDRIKSSKFKGMDLAYYYYLEYGQKWFKNTPTTIGLMGEGSECYGFDDCLSRDHDFNARFMVFVETSKELELYKSYYQQLPDSFMGFKKSTIEYRHGIFVLEEYLDRLFGPFYKLNKITDWFYLEESKLAMFQNGQLFKNDLVLFNEVRQRLSYYPDDVRIKKIMVRLAKMAQSGQYNYQRLMYRHDRLAAYQALNLFVDETIQLLYLLASQYSPFYKWRIRFAKEKGMYLDIIDRLENLVQMPLDLSLYNIEEVKSVQTEDKIVMGIEKICERIVEELNVQGLSHSKDVFLQNHLEGLRNKMSDEKIRRMHVMEE